MLSKLERWFRFLIGGLEKQGRWRRFKKHTPENVLEHSYKMALLMQVMLSLEDLYGNHKLNKYRLLQCAINHDWGEAINGDIPLPSKTEENELEEDKAFQQIIDLGIPIMIRDEFPKPINRDDTADQTHKEFWNAFEQVGYVLYAKEEISLGRLSFWSIVNNHQEQLLTYARKFPSVKLFCQAFYEVK